MSDVLAKICDDKKRHIAARKSEVPEAELARRAARQTPPRGFAKALRQTVDSGEFSLIAEIKKASPSKGLIRDDFAPDILARAYKAGGATCLSVLTDTPYFQGKGGDLATAREAVDLPVLRKDFMLDPYQILESRCLGADCILLIMAALDDQVAADLEATAHALGMDVLIEVHNADELARALKLTSPLIGVNNRNLKTLEIDLKVTEDLSASIPTDRVLIAESGLYSHADLVRMARVGARRFLVGESLMRQDDVTVATRNLLGLPVQERSAG